MALPEIENPLRAVVGQTPTAVWLLGHDNLLLLHDGQRVVRSYPKICSAADPNREMWSPRLDALALTDDGVAVLGTGPLDASLGDAVIATQDAKGKWRCTYRQDAGGVDGSRSTAHGAAWNLYEANLKGEMLQAVLGPRPQASPPSVGGVRSARVSLVSPRHAWFGWIPSDPNLPTKLGLAHYNGIAWRLHAAPPGDRFVDLWSDGQSTLWAITVSEQTGAGGSSTATPTVLRFDGQRWTRLPLIRGFSPKLVRGVGPAQAWMVGNNKAYFWDGRAAKAFNLPLTEVSEA